MPSSPFLRRFHARFGAPRERVVSLVERYVDDGVTSLRRVVNGYDNEVYRVEFVGAEAVYVRIRRGGEGAFEWEAWAMSKARTAGVPVPEVLAHAHLDLAEGRREVMIVAAAPGRTLETLATESDRRDRAVALRSLGQMLRRLHSVRMPGPWRPDGSGRWPTMPQLREGFVADRLAERPYLRQAGLSPGEIEHIVDALLLFPGPAPAVSVLCHGDLKPEHVFCDANQRVSGLIDWGMSHAGSPLGELAYAWETFGTDGLETILDGYGSGSMSDPQFRTLVATTAVQQQIGHIAHHVSIDDPDGLARNVAFMRRALVELG